MYTGEADHSVTAELVERVSVPVIASGDITSREKAVSVLEQTGAAAVMVARGAQGNPWALREIAEGDSFRPTREEVAAELVVFIREAVRELGEQRAVGFLKKFYGWYLGHGRFPKPFKQELVQLETTEEVVTRLFAAAPGAAPLVELLEAESGLSLVFVRTKRGADRLAHKLAQRGIPVLAMHGDRSQPQRERALEKFRTGKVTTLVATDVAARGLDLEAIAHVINFDPPEDDKGYVHRVGRTGRAGRAGRGSTLVMPHQQAEVGRAALRLGHGDKFEQTGMPVARAKLVYTSRGGRRSRW